MTPSSIQRFFEISLLGMLAGGLAAITGTGTLDLPSLAISWAAVAARVAIIGGWVRGRIPERTATILAVAYIGFYPLDYRYLSGDFLTATVHLVFFLGSVLILKAQTRRDYTLVQVIAFLEILAASLLSVNASFLLFLGVFLLASVGALASGEILGRLQDGGAGARTGFGGSRRSLAALTVAAFMSILIVGGGMFFVLPRTARAALQQLVPERFHLPGFSNEVTLGQIGAIRMTSTPVMHARLYNTVPVAGMKWRGTTLGRFDGHRWYNEASRGETVVIEKQYARLADSLQQQRIGRRVQYEVQLRDATSDALFFLGVPEAIQIDAPRIVRTSAGGYRLPGQAHHVRYAASSYIGGGELQDHSVFGLPPETRDLYLQLPPHDPRIDALAARLTSGVIGEQARARALDRHLRESYAYTTELLSQPVSDPVAHFLFERRKGHCEYFASALAVMLRTVGIPSRIATGFQSGVYNPISDWYLIRASDAHSWVEAFLEGRGWVTLDPTPPDANPRPETLWSRLVLYSDAMDVFWQEWVMSYDLERQVLLADRVGRGSRWLNFDGSTAAEWRVRWQRWKQNWNWTWAGLALAALLLAALLIPSAPRLHRWWRSRETVRRVEGGRGAASDATLLYQRMLALLAARGLERPAWITPAEFAASADRRLNGTLVGEVTRAYNELRFGGHAGAASRMVTLLETLERRLAA